jgi:hypothetical protein
MLQPTSVIHDSNSRALVEVEMHVHPSEAAVPTMKSSVNATGWCDEGAAINRSMGCMSASVSGRASN